MFLIRLLTLIFVAFALSRVFLRFRDRSLGIGPLLFWISVWSSVTALVFYPRIADWSASLLGLQRGTDSSFFFAILLLFYLIFRLYIKIDTLDRDITRLNQNASIALRERDTSSR